MSGVKRDSPQIRLNRRHIPVVDNQQLVGMISIGDLLAHEVPKQAETIQYLNEYLYGPGAELGGSP